MAATAKDNPGQPRTTPLFSAHRRLGAKVIDFGGWWMPVNYPSGIIDEHRTTRRAVGVFDVCHMGEVHFRGARAAEAVQRLVTNEVGRLPPGRALYALVCRPNGGIVDDLIVYRVADQHFLLVVNASNIEKDFAWFQENVGGWCELTDASPETGLIAFQGPRAEEALQALTTLPLGNLRSFDFVSQHEVGGFSCSLARTGYTAEDGFEIFCDAADAEPLWNRLLEVAAAVGGKPVGLGARDTLRLEGRLSLYGNDLSEETTPLEAGLGWAVKLESAAEFIGKPALIAQKAEGVKKKLVGFVMLGRGIARHGYPIHAADAPNPAATPIGEVTSGAPGPTVEKNIGMGYVPASQGEPGGRLLIDCRGKLVEAEIVKGPFYRRPNRGAP